MAFAFRHGVNLCSPGHKGHHDVLAVQVDFLVRHAPATARIIRDDLDSVDLAGIGERVDTSRPLARIHARSEEDARAAADALHRAYRLADGPVTPPALVQERIA